MGQLDITCKSLGKKPTDLCFMDIFFKYNNETDYRLESFQGSAIGFVKRVNKIINRAHLTGLPFQCKWHTSQPQKPFINQSTVEA